MKGPRFFVAYDNLNMQWVVLDKDNMVFDEATDGLKPLAVADRKSYAQQTADKLNAGGKL